MCWENESCRIDAHCTLLYSRALGIIRGSGRESVPLHHASRHAWIDISHALITHATHHPATTFSIDLDPHAATQQVRAGRGELIPAIWTVGLITVRSLMHAGPMSSPSAPLTSSAPTERPHLAHLSLLTPS
jgi:hypothetical protein